MHMHFAERKNSMNTFTDLILLIGTNPLPNFIVAEYFLKNNNALQRIWFVYSEETGKQASTKKQADNLEDILKKIYSNTISFTLNGIALSDVSNAKVIKENTDEKLIGRLPHGAHVHLNYTGGTKAMGTHVYRTLEQDSTKNLIRSYSYLDGRNFQIVNDEGLIIATDLRKEVSISFIKLINLHGFKRKNEPSDSLFNSAVTIFRRTIEQSQLDGYFQADGGYDRTLFENNDGYGDLAKKKTALKDNLKTHLAKGIFLEVVQAMPGEYQLFDKSGNFVEPSSNKKCEYAIEFLDGKWFEEYVYAALKNTLLLSNVVIDKNWVIDKTGWTTDFEMDVTLLNGYQLIGISCTTSDKTHVCKSKGFEIILRTRQIGGDEAKAVLITRLCDEQKRRLQDVLELNTGATSGNILVLGKNDLKEELLKQAIKNFIQQD